MRKLDEIMLWACIGVIAILAFLGGLLTAVLIVWIFLFNGGVHDMTNGCYIIHDLRNDTEIRCADYDAYITYFQNELKPEGLGTRYLFSEITKARQCYHLRLVKEPNKHGKKALS